MKNSVKKAAANRLLICMAAAGLLAACGGTNNSASTNSQAKLLIDPASVKINITAANVTASSTDAANVPGNAVDGNLATHWTGGAASGTQWIQFKLPACYTADYTKISWYNGDQRQYTYTIQGSADNGATWTSIKTVTTDGLSAALVQMDFPNMAANMMRISSSGSNVSTKVSINEVEFWGLAGATCGTTTTSSTATTSTTTTTAATTTTTTAGSTPPNFGPNVMIFDPSMSASSIQSKVNTVFSQQESNQFGSARYALVFKPGSYSVDVNVGFYTQVLGLGKSPDDVTINGAVHAEADWFQGNATQNFWRSAENMSVNPTGGLNRWAVSQASPFRRMHIRGNLQLDDGGWASGGFLSDSKIDGQIKSGTQQQWFSRNSQIGSWAGSNWNMVFAGVDGAPSGATWPSPPNTVIATTPILREKPFLTIDAAGKYGVFVPAVSTNGHGTTWAGGAAPGQTLSIDTFYIAKSGDNAASMNAALSAGKNLIITPGVYHLNAALNITKANTVVLGLGLASLVPDNGVKAMTVADVDGVKIAGLLFDAGTVNSPILLEVGPTGNALSHAGNPTSLHDLFFRIGGATVGKASASLVINSNDVIGDHFWIWRADHGNGGTVGWNTNTAANGLIVNGVNVTIYGLFVEHFQQYQTTWNADGGRVYFYQSEIPYDVPNQASWMNAGKNGFAAYKVADWVTTHQAYGVGAYCYFSTNSSVKLANAYEVPAAGLGGAMFHNMITVSLGGVGEITHIINGYGAAANSAANVARLAQ